MVPGTQPAGRIDLNDLAKLVPRFGNFCGPGWSAGREDPNIAPEDILAGQVLRLFDASGKEHISQLDLLCQQHDYAYSLAQGKSNQAALIAQADLIFLNGLASKFAVMEPGEKTYALLAAAAFTAKIEYYDAPLTLWSLMKPISAAPSDVDNDGLPHGIEQDGVRYSAGVSADGQLITSRSDGHDFMTLRLDMNQHTIGLIQRQVDESGQPVNEMRIDTDTDTKRSMLLYSTDAEEDLQGIVLGNLTQGKLDQFVGLGLAALGSGAPADNPASDSDMAGGAASSVLSSLDIDIGDRALDALDLWFDNADALVLEPYRWESIDADLQAFWQAGSDQVLAAYDLGAALDDVGWTPDDGSEWQPPDLQPVFSDMTDLAESPAPIFLASSEDSTSSTDDDSSFYDNFSGSSTSWYSSWRQDGGFDSYYGSVDYVDSYVDPLVLKLGGGAVHTTNRLGSNVMFDMNADGIRDRTGWITADEAFLVLDRNGNGSIDDVSEMFSEYASASAATGFGALAELDSHRDGWVKRSDKAFGKLQLWTDINVNGLTDAGELHALKEFGIIALAARAANLLNQYDNGNLVSGVATYYSIVDASIRSGQIAEVLFNYGDKAPVATVYLSDQASTVRTASGKAIEVLADKAAQNVNASLSGVNVLVGGAGDVLNAGNAGQSLLIGNGKTTLNGNAGDVHFIVNGSGNVVTTGTGTSWIEVHGDANRINAAKGDVTLDVDGDRNKITLGSGADVTLGGAGNTLTAAAKSHDNTILVTGIHEVVIASDADIAIDEAASLTLRGKNNDLVMQGHASLSGSASGGTLTVSGEQNIATLSGAFIALAADSELILTGAAHQIVMGGHADLTMKSSGTGSTIYVTGDDNQLDASSAKIILADGAGLSVDGSGDKISLLDDAELNAAGSAHRIDVYGTDNQVGASRSTVLEHAHADLVLVGTGNVLRVTPDNSAAAPAELAARSTLETQMEMALAEFNKLIAEIQDRDTAVGNISTVGILSPEVSGLAPATSGILL